VVEPNRPSSASNLECILKSLQIPLIYQRIFRSCRSWRNKVIVTTLAETPILNGVDAGCVFTLRHVYEASSQFPILRALIR